MVGAADRSIYAGLSGLVASDLTAFAWHFAVWTPTPDHVVLDLSGVAYLRPKTGSKAGEKTEDFWVKTRH